MADIFKSLIDKAKKGETTPLVAYLNSMKTLSADDRKLLGSLIWNKLEKKERGSTRPTKEERAALEQAFTNWYWLYTKEVGLLTEGVPKKHKKGRAKEINSRLIARAIKMTEPKHPNVKINPDDLESEIHNHHWPK